MGILNYQVAASGDDGYWYQTTISIDNAALQIGGTTIRDIKYSDGETAVWAGTCGG